MANKKYNDYEPGSYDEDKLILQADSTTGALEKIQLKQIPPYKNLIYTDISDHYFDYEINNEFASFYIPAYSFLRTGSSIVVEIGGEIYAASEFLSITYQFNDDASVTLGIPNVGLFVYTFTLIRTSETTLKIYANIVSGGVVTYQYPIEATVTDFAIPFNNRFWIYEPVDIDMTVRTVRAKIDYN